MRLSQDWVMRYPLIDVHGNNGNILGDGPASSRYTEARLSKLSEDGMLKNIKKNVVDTILNYDETENEPITLPAVFPNLLCNPNEGIGWAMGSSWAPHNLREVAAIINEVLDGKEPTFLAPDFPTGGIIINKNDIPNIVKTGKGSVKIRGKYKIEGQNIVFYELPYGTRLESLMDEVGKLSDEEKIGHIVSVRNETGKKGLRLVIEVEKGTDPEFIVTILFAKTNLQSSFSYNQVALINKTPTELNLLEAVKVYINHNLDCIQRETKFDLTKAENRFHIVEGLLVALEDINNVIELIKKSESVSVAQHNLINSYSLSKIQAKAILDMKLSRLAKLEKVELETEKQELINTISDLKDILSTKARQEDILRNRLSEIVQKYGDDRRTEVTQIEVTKADKEVQNVEPERVVVVMTESGLIKRVPISSYKTQRRGGKGIKSTDDIINSTIRTNTVDSLMIFTNKGNMYRLIVNNIPEGTNSSKGVNVRNLINMEPSEQPAAIYSIYKDNKEKYVLFATKKGLVKKTNLDEYVKTKKKTGLTAISLREGDAIASVTLIDEESIILVTKNGMCIKFDSKEVSVTGRATSGVKGVNLADGDEVIECLPIRNKNDSLAIFLESGLGKRIKLSDLVLQKKAGKGIICSKSIPVATAALVEDSDSLLVTGAAKSIVIEAKEIPTLGRIAVGNIIIKSKIDSVTKI